MKIGELKSPTGWRLRAAERAGSASNASRAPARTAIRILALTSLPPLAGEELRPEDGDRA
jgi:hypothetical protein